MCGWVWRHTQKEESQVQVATGAPAHYFIFFQSENRNHIFNTSPTNSVAFRMFCVYILSLLFHLDIKPKEAFQRKKR